ncbi:hypothetical protein J21TS7_62920 [Paenibacillus cineris]|uniref:Uncharacterized protein n=1 Tax=Paenibacillus cineris TaxID=237530 RepID=A0ABQ4LNA4_9BACL|nr:hypothetical protein J21TS7_62920 [Paenibacillus cineris]
MFLEGNPDIPWGNLMPIFWRLMAVPSLILPATEQIHLDCRLLPSDQIVVAACDWIAVD